MGAQTLPFLEGRRVGPEAMPPQSSQALPGRVQGWARELDSTEQTISSWVAAEASFLRQAWPRRGGKGPSDTEDRREKEKEREKRGYYIGINPLLGLRIPLKGLLFGQVH